MDFHGQVLQTIELDRIILILGAAAIISTAAAVVLIIITTCNLTLHTVVYLLDVGTQLLGIANK